MSKVVEFKKAIAKRDAIQAITLGIVDSDPSYPMQLGDTLVSLQYTYGPVSRIFKQTGINVNMTDIGPQHIGNPEVFEVILREGLRINHPNLFADEGLMDRVNMKHMSYYLACIQLALQSNEPDPVVVSEALEAIDAEYDAQGELPLADDSTSPASGLDALPVEYVPQKSN